MSDKGKVHVDITAKDEASEKLNTVGKHGTNLKTVFKNIAIAAAAAAAAITAATGKMLKDWADAGDEIAKTAKRMGWTAESTSEMAYAAKISGAALSDVETATKKLSSAIIDGNDGLATYKLAFDKLGLSTEDLLKLPTEDQFWAVAQALSGVEDKTLQTSLAVDLFGRSGTNLLPLLQEGADGIQELRDRAHEMGIVFDEDAAAGAEGLTDAMTDMEASIEGIRNAIAQELAPVITDIINNQIIPAVQGFKEWWQENEKIIETFDGILSGIVNLIEKLPAFIDKLETIYGIYKDIMDMPLGLGSLFGTMLNPVQATQDYFTQGDDMLRQSAMSGYDWNERGYNTEVTVNVAGSVIAERDLAEVVRAQLVDVDSQNNGTGIE